MAEAADTSFSKGDSFMKPVDLNVSEVPTIFTFCRNQMETASAHPLLPASLQPHFYTERRHSIYCSMRP